MMCEDHSSLTLCLCLSTVLLTGATAYCQASGETVLVFSKPFAGVYLKRGNSSKRIILRHGPSLAPRLSPDGSRLLVNSFKGGGRGVWIGHQDGEEMKRICDGDQGEWSPEGDRIVFRRDGRIVERRLDTGADQVVTPATWTDCRFPSYRSDGSIIFVRGKGAGSRVFLLDSKTGDAPKAVLAAEIRSAPRCSPDGKVLAYQDGAHIHLMNLEDGRRSQLTTAGGVQSWPIWSLDGKGVAYCQAPDPSGPWEVHLVPIPTQGPDFDFIDVEAGNPVAARIIQRGVDLAPDWRGIGAPSAQSVSLKGAYFSVRARESNGEPLSLARIPSSREGWKPLPDVRERLAVQSPVLVENDWHSVVIAPGQGALAVFSKAQGSDAKPVTIGLAAEKAAAVSDGTYSYAILTSGRDEFLCEISFKDEAGRAAKALCRISRAKPYIELTPLSDVREFHITNDMPFVLMPDRFSNDLLIEAAGYSAPEIFLPSSPFVLAPSADGGSVVMLITPSSRQSLSLVRNRGVFSHIRADPAGEPLFISLLPPQSVFPDLPAEADAEAKATKIAWSSPFAARWRVSLFGAAKNHSLMVDAEKPSKVKAIKGFTEPVETALAYLYGRNGRTPLNILTPEDILRDTLGIQSSERLLDTEGITGYRTTEEPIPLHELLLPSSSRYRPGQVQGRTRTPWSIAWRRFLRPQLDFSPVLELSGGGDYGAINMAKTKGVESVVGHFCGDISNLLKGLDDRTGEYETFISDLDGLCRTEKKENSQATEFLDGIKAEIEGLKTRRANLPLTDIAEVHDCIENIQALFGSGGRLGKKKEFERFSEVSILALAERQAVLREYRELAKATRDKAGLVITEKPEAKELAEGIRELTQKVLRNRYYLEGDWRGETPWNGDDR